MLWGFFFCFMGITGKYMVIYLPVPAMIAFIFTFERKLDATSKLEFRSAVYCNNRLIGQTLTCCCVEGTGPSLHILQVVQ